MTILSSSNKLMHDANVEWALEYESSMYDVDSPEFIAGIDNYDIEDTYNIDDIDDADYSNTQDVYCRYEDEDYLPF